MLQVVVQHIQKIHYPWHVIHQRQHDHAEGILQLGVLVQLVQKNIGVHVFTKLDHHPHAFPAGLVA